MSESVGLERAAELIRGAQRIAVFTHVNPDGDAIGSSFGLGGVLRALGKQFKLFFANPIPDSYRPFAFLPFQTEAEDLADFDLAIQVDTANSERIAAPQGVTVSNTLPLLVIDHHPDNQRYGRWNVVGDNAAACEMIYKLSQMLIGKPDKETATALLLGMISDTGCFRYTNSTPGALTTAAELIGVGAAHTEIINALFFSKDEKRARFEGELVAGHMDFHFDGKVVIVRIPPQLIEKYSINMADTEGLVDVFRALKNVEIAIVMYLRPDGQLKLTIRAENPERPVAPIARALGGGGHNMAAGCLREHGDAARATDEVLKLLQDNYYR